MLPQVSAPKAVASLCEPEDPPKLPWDVVTLSEARSRARREIANAFRSVDKAQGPASRHAKWGATGFLEARD